MSSSIDSPFQILEGNIGLEMVSKNTRRFLFLATTTVVCREAQLLRSGIIYHNGKLHNLDCTQRVYIVLYKILRYYRSLVVHAHHLILLSVYR